MNRYPKWRNAARRPSCQDAVTLLRKQIEARGARRPMWLATPPWFKPPRPEPLYPDLAPLEALQMSKLQLGISWNCPLAV